ERLELLAKGAVGLGRLDVLYAHVPHPPYGDASGERARRAFGWLPRGAGVGEAPRLRELTWIEGRQVAPPLRSQRHLQEPGPDTLEDEVAVLSWSDREVDPAARCV